MTCSKCKKMSDLPPATLEIINRCDPVLFHKVLRNANLGDDTAENGTPPNELDYKNVLLVYEANNHAYLYSSDGAYTFISMGELDVDKIMEQLRQLMQDVQNLQETDTQLQAHIDMLSTSLNETNANVADNASNITALGNTVNAQAQEILQNKTDIATNTTDIQTNQDSILELQTDLGKETANRVSADETLQDNINANTQAIDQNKSSIDAINASLDVYVEKETEFNGNDSTLDVVHTKINLKDSTTQETTDALPVASETSAGIMNAATYSAVQENSENVDSILNGAVALNDLPESPTQEDLTTQWKNATGKTELVNRASIFDVTNNKLWYYYTNANMWYGVAAEGGTVTVNQATNDSLGIVKGSTRPGQNFVEADGSTSLNGWDDTQSAISTLQSTVSEQGELLNTTAAQLEETQKDANDALADIAAIQADYVSKTKVLTAYTVSPAEGTIYNAEYVNSGLNSKINVADIMTVEEFNAAWDAA